MNEFAPSVQKETFETRDNLGQLYKYSIERMGSRVVLRDIQTPLGFATVGLAIPVEVITQIAGNMSLTVKLAPPKITNIIYDVAAGVVRITGQNFLSEDPNRTKLVVKLTPVDVEFDQATFTTFTDVLIEIDATVYLSGVVEGDLLFVVADGRSSNTLDIVLKAVVTTATLMLNGSVEIEGTDFLSRPGLESSVEFVGTFAKMLTQKLILNQLGEFSDTKIIIPEQLVEGIVAIGTGIVVKANQEFSELIPMIEEV